MVQALTDELLEEILFRLAADDPACLVHAALVCKRWRRLVSDPEFHRRFRAFRRKPAMLGVLCNIESSNISRSRGKPTARFVPTVSWFRQLHAVRGDDWAAIDARHGRVLLHKPVYLENSTDVVSHHEFEVWDPITDELKAIPSLPAGPRCWNAAVLCAAGTSGGCDHIDCHRGPFMIVLVASTEDDDQNFVRLYSSEEDGSWSEPAYTAGPDDVQYSRSNSASSSTALVGNALYFVTSASKFIVSYNLDTREMSMIRRPTLCCYRRVALMVAEDGGLGMAMILNFRLYIWSRENGHDTDEGWALGRVIELTNLLPDSALPTNSNVIGGPTEVFGVADHIGVLLLWSRADGLFIIDLKSGQASKIYQDSNLLSSVIAYMSFYTPGTSLTHPSI